jgi:hypothetical protein
MNLFDRAGGVVFGLVRTLAWICAGVALIAWWSGGWTVAAPWLRTAGLFGLTVYSPIIATRLFCAIDIWRQQKRRASGS